MALITNSLNMNGTTAFTIYGQTYTWGAFSTVGLFAGDPPNTYKLNLTMSGTDWGIAKLDLEANSAFAVTITDTNDGLRRNINYLAIGDGVSNLNLTLYNSRIRFIEGGIGNTTLTMGAQTTREIVLYNGNDTVTQGTGQILSVLLGSGINVFNGSSARVNYLEFGPGTNTFNGGTGTFGSVRADGNNTFTLQNGGDQIAFGQGNNALVLNGGFIGSLNALGNNTVSLHGSAVISQIEMGQGTNQLTSEDGTINAITSYFAQNTILLGAGGADQINIGGSAAAQVIRSDGWIGSLQIYAGDQINVKATTVVLGDGAGYVQTSKGDDKINTGDGYVGHIETFDGKDTVTVGSGGAGSISTGADNDTVKLTALGPDFIVLIQGGDGIDLLDLSALASGVTVSLGLNGAWQEFGLPDSGAISLFQVEDLIGTSKADSLSGNMDNNALTGALGNDSLSGLDGDDRLIGGKGNDTMTGGLGLDTFIFKAGDGNDRVTDFTLGEDHLSIAGTNKLGDITFAKAGLNVDVSVGTLHILVENMTVADLRDASNFLF